MSPVLKPVALVAVVLAACLSLSPAPSALSPDAAEVQLQMAQLLFNDGRYVEAFDVFEHLKTSEDPRVRREALRGSVTTALRLGDFSHAYADAQILVRDARVVDFRHHRRFHMLQTFETMKRRGRLKRDQLDRGAELTKSACGAATCTPKSKLWNELRFFATCVVANTMCSLASIFSARDWICQRYRS